MDRQRDFKSFQNLMDQLCATFHDGRKANNPLVEAYWYALGDVSIEEVAAHVKKIIANATKDTRFPKPRELRTVAPAAAPDAMAERLSEETWNELRERDPIRFEVELRIAQAASKLRPLGPLDPGFDEWSRELAAWLALRYAPREAQEAAVARLQKRRR